MIVVWTPEAEQDRADIWDHIAADNSGAAARMDALFSTAAARLASHPQLGRPGKIPGTRELIPHPSYRLVYEIDEEKVWVLAWCTRPANGRRFGSRGARSCSAPRMMVAMTFPGPDARADKGIVPAINLDGNGSARSQKRRSEERTSTARLLDTPKRLRRHRVRDHVDRGPIKVQIWTGAVGG